jgi:protein MBA1
MASSLWRSPSSLRRVVRSGTPIAEFYQSAPSPSSAVVAYCQCRFFSQSQMAQRGLSGIPQNISVKQPAQPSMRTRGRELSRSELPQDIGLLPGTFIRPLWRDMPSIFQQPKERLQLEWLWLKNAVQNFLGYVCRSSFTAIRENFRVAWGFSKTVWC